jgi:hypothetical protein
MAGDDEAFQKRLARFPDEATFAKSFRSLEQKLSSGEYKKPLARTPRPKRRRFGARKTACPRRRKSTLPSWRCRTVW